ncbi:MAG: valyl-tRNA synthetase, partial [Reinekea sp.]
TRQTLVQVLETLMRLLHPIMPFISEEIWQNIKAVSGATGDSLMIQSFPIVDESKIDTAAEADLEWVKGVIMGVRNIRGEMDIAPSKAIPILLQNGTAEDKRRYEENAKFLTQLAKLESITWVNEGDEVPHSATALVDKLKVLVPMAGLINVEAELTRVAKEVDKVNKELARIEGKLNNEKFIGKAPQDVVDKEKAKAAALQDKLTDLNAQAEQLKALA